MAASVHQLLAGFAAGDAISHEATAIRDLCRHHHISSEIFAPPDRIAPESKQECRPLEEYRQGPSDIAICHYSIASPVTEAFLSSPAKKAVIYHNITPAEFYRPFDATITEQLTQARAGLKDTVLRADAVWADSAFNASELRAMGVENVKVFPLLFTPAILDLPPDPAVLGRFATPMKNILFVGRLAPNKCIEDLITAFAWFNKRIEPQSRLLIVGSDRSTSAYFAMLKMYAGELELPNVCFQRFASPEGLSAYYNLAHLFVTTSRHEGYCLPLVEAMYKGVPAIARRTGGTPEAMGGAGVLYDGLKPEELAELFAFVLTDDAVRREILESQQKRIREILERPVWKEFSSLLSQFVTIP
jgi:glycosyltransferase involved in cell wall biosynthesis